MKAKCRFFWTTTKKRKRKVSKLRSSVCLSVKKAFGVDSFIIKLYIIKLKAGDSLRVKKHTSSEASENDDDSDDERRFLFPNQTTITSSRPSSWRFSPWFLSTLALSPRRERPAFPGASSSKLPKTRWRTIAYSRSCWSFSSFASQPSIGLFCALFYTPSSTRFLPAFFFARTKTWSSRWGTKTFWSLWGTFSCLVLLMMREGKEGGNEVSKQREWVVF